MPKLKRSRRQGVALAERRLRLLAESRLPLGTHDLAAILVEVQEEYFDGHQQATIRWSRRLPRRRRQFRTFSMATVAIEKRVITVNRLMNQSLVPRDFIKYLVFHELLHLKVRPRPPGPWRFHYRRFRIEERTFARYDWAMKWEERNYDRLVRPLILRRNKGKKRKNIQGAKA